MKKALITGVVIFIGLIILFYSYVIPRQQELDETVKTDFADKYPSYQFIECVAGEGDMAVAYVHVRFKKKSTDDKIQEEVWQYWDTDSGWLHRDKMKWK